MERARRVGGVAYGDRGVRRHCPRAWRAIGGAELPVSAGVFCGSVAVSCGLRGESISLRSGMNTVPLNALQTNDAPTTPSTNLQPITTGDVTGSVTFRAIPCSFHEAFAQPGGNRA